MVRIIAGTLIYAGYGKIKKSDVKLAFKNLDRNLAGIVAPSKALFLKEVIY
jgi:tRNA U38,U39,U40 pseudouridine synthase TruA